MSVFNNISASTRGSLELSLAMVLSGSIGYFVVNSGQSAWNVVFFRCLFAALSLGLYAWYRGIFNRQYLQKNTLWLILLGGGTLVGNWVLLFTSFEFVPFSIATVAYHTQPLFLVLAGSWLMAEKTSVQVYAWLAVAFIGLFLMINIEEGQLNELFSEGVFKTSDALIGVILALAAAVLYTVTTLVTKKIADAPPYFVALLQVILGCFMLLPLVDFSALPQQGHQWGALAILGVVHTCFMYILLYASFQKLSTSLIALLSFIYPVVALMVDHYAFGTQISWQQGIGIMMILLAACAVKFGWRLLPIKRADKIV